MTGAADGVTVRPAGPEDADRVVASESENLGADAWSAGLVAAGLAGDVPTAHYLVAEVDGELAGHAVVSVVVDVAELQRIAVFPAYRRRGVAAALLAEVARLARDGAADLLLLEVREDNAAAKAFYASAGFAEIDRRPRYYADGTTAVVLRLSLGGGGG